MTLTSRHVGSRALSASEAITITVTNTNRAPVLAAIGNKSVAENAALTFTISATDPDSDTVSYSATGLPAGATLNATTGAFSWTPGYDQAGSYPVTFTATDNGSPALSASEAITITVTNTNRAPVANPQSVTTPANTAKAITLTATDVDGDTLTYSVVTGPAHGALSGTAPNVTYRPAANYTGADSFTFKANDGTVDSATATVSITVTGVPSLSIANTSVLEGNG